MALSRNVCTDAILKMPELLDECDRRGGQCTQLRNATSESHVRATSLVSLDRRHIAYYETCSVRVRGKAVCQSINMR